MKMTFNDLFAAFIVYGQFEHGYAAESLQKFKECYRCWVQPRIGARNVEEVTLEDILQLRRGLLDAGRSVARQYSILTLLKLLFRYARERLRVACLDPTEIHLPKRVFKRVEFLTDNEVDRMLSAVRTHTFAGQRLRVLLEVLLSTGMRISEALSLNRDSIDWEQGEAEIVGKGNRQRTVFFSPRCLIWIQELLATRRDRHPAVFITNGSAPRRLTRNNISKVFIRLRQRSGISKKLTPHLLRHTFCTSLLHRGADIMFIKELAGHRDIQITARYYLGVSKEALRAVLNRCQIYGWRQTISAAIMPPQEGHSHIPGTAGVPLLRPAGPGQDSIDTSFPAVRAQGSL